MNTEGIFNLQELGRYAQVLPVVVGQMPGEEVDLGQLRINHYLIRSNDQDGDWDGLPEGLPEGVVKFIDRCVGHLREGGLMEEAERRYWYLTVDQGLVSGDGGTLRESGWHIDGLQGMEVSCKMPGDFQFIWSDVLPTEFCIQDFDMRGVDVGVHNVFQWLGKQVIGTERVVQFGAGTIIGMHCYHVHRAAVNRSGVDVYRRFMRLSFTYTPITSVKMSLNPRMAYNYDYHTTTGEIPGNLV